MIKALSLAALMSATASSTFLLKDETNVVVDFQANLGCAACIRGGYFYCDTTN